MQTYNQDSQYSAQDIEKAKQTLHQIMDGLINSELHPYQGEWLTTDEYKQRNTRDSHKARIHFREIIALNIFITLLSAFLILLLSLLCY